MFTCRFYENELPPVGDLVMGRVIEVSDLGATIELLEYAGKRAMVPISEFSRRRLRSLNKCMRVGSQTVFQVLVVDPDKGYVDLSKKSVTQDEIQQHRNRFKKSKTVHTILRSVAENPKNEQFSLEDLYQRVVWAQDVPETVHIHDWLERWVQHPKDFSSENADIHFDLPSEVYNLLNNVLQRKMALPWIKLEARFELTCFTEAGIDGIKASLHEGLRCVPNESFTEYQSLSLVLVSSPEYSVSLVTKNVEEGKNLVQILLSTIEQKIQSFGGNYGLKQGPIPL